jgi:hypothetical protein
MIEKLTVINFLLNEIQEEIELTEKFKAEQKRAKKEAKDIDQNYWHCLKWKGRTPSKSRITEDCKKIRQLLLEINKKIESEEK